MDPFIRRLIERLHDPRKPLSRNRHFQTFATPEGQAALRLSRRLRSLQQDVLESSREGTPARVRRADGDTCHVEIRFERLRGTRSALLTQDELELLTELPGVRESVQLDF